MKRISWPPGRQGWLLGGAAIALLILLILVVAPSQNPLRAGSTYSRAPDGYGAWYAAMQAQGIPVQRWQQPFSQLGELTAPQGVTLLRVNPLPTPGIFLANEASWVEQGNTLVVLGVREPVTPAQFRSRHPSPAGLIRIDTRRRHQLKPGQSEQPGQLGRPETVRLGDRFGAIVWQFPLGKGQVILAVTPHLAANAYQNEAGNFPFLTQLLTQTGQPIWVNEYIHSYRDRETLAQKGREDWVSYLGQTAWGWVAIQGSFLLLLLIWANNRRLGPAVRLTEPKVDDSQAYIEALAGVLRQAGSHGFVLDRLGHAEKRHIQLALGLGTGPIAASILIAAWVEQTGQPSTALETFLQLVENPPAKLSEATLRDWLAALHTIQQQLSIMFPERSTVSPQRLFS